MIIYKVTNRINGKVYIGQTVQKLAVRWAAHCAPSSGCTALHNAIVKHGAANFTVEQIDVACSRPELDEKERYWIAHYDCIAPKGYNLCEGGDGCLGYKHSEDTRRLLSDLRKGKPGAPHSDEWKQATSDRQKGGKHPHKGHPLSEEQKAILSAYRKGKPYPPKYKPVRCIDKDVVFESLKSAAECMGVNKSAIINAIKRGNRCCGMRWEYGDGKAVRSNPTCL